MTEQLQAINTVMMDFIGDIYAMVSAPPLFYFVVLFLIFGVFALIISLIRNSV